MPPVMPLTMPSLRFCMAATSIAGVPTPMPCALNSCAARWNSSEDSSKALEGMHPAFRQVPPKALLPSRFFQPSMQAVFRPFWAARIAPGYPPGPPPMTMTSYLSVMASDPDQQATRILQDVLDRHQKLHGFLA